MSSRHCNLYCSNSRLVRERIITADPLAGLSAINARAERIEHRALTIDEMQRVL
jgi:hypothetical protein